MAQLRRRPARVAGSEALVASRSTLMSAPDDAVPPTTAWERARGHVRQTAISG
jgi:hypothetical protein